MGLHGDDTKNIVKKAKEMLAIATGELGVRKDCGCLGESHTCTLHSRKPIGCIQFKLVLYEGEDLGTFFTWWRHVIYIHFLPGKNFAIAYFRGKMNYQYYQIMMLMGRTLNPNRVSEDLQGVREE
ncbi:hypothetical protein ACRRTK_024433 [Alexandromys fortis]